MGRIMTPDEAIAQQLHDALAAGDDQAFAELVARVDSEDATRMARLSRVEALLEGALYYAKQGIAVFPIKAGEKRPLLPRAHELGNPCKGECGRDGHGLYDATTDPDRIRAWWKSTPAANIGIPTGHLVDVIDVDLPDGYHSLGELRESGLIPPILGRVITASGGTHLYIHPTGDGNTAGLRPGIDYRGAGGYVVAPPSRSAEGMWLWTTPLNPGATA